MAKARMLSQEAAEDTKLGLCSLEAAFTYLLIIPFLDRDGLVTGKPSWIAGRALPERPHLQHRVGSYIQEWVTQGLVIRYEGNDGPVLFFPGFRKHNANLDYRREPKSKFPPPPGYEYGEDGLLPSNPNLARTVADSFDKRNSYHIALIAHAKRIEEKEASGRDTADDLIEDALGFSTSHKDSTEFHRKVTGNSDEALVKVNGDSGESHRLIEVNIREDQEKEKGREESNNNGAEAPPARPVSSKDHPLIRAFHELHNRYPNRTQIAAIIEHDPPPEDWRRAIHAWSMAGHNPTNVQGMIEWALEPSRFENTRRAAQGEPDEAARRKAYTEFNNFEATS